MEEVKNIREEIERQQTPGHLLSSSLQEVISRLIKHKKRIKLSN
jgi:hypothetical protein